MISVSKKGQSGLPPAVVERVRNIVTFLQEMEDGQEFRDIPNYLSRPLFSRSFSTLILSRDLRKVFMNRGASNFALFQPSEQKTENL
jgi:hypothetical protein